MKKIGIGVLGCANIAHRSVIPAILSLEDLKLVAVASRTEEKAQRFAETFRCEGIGGYQELLDRKDIDAIYMPLPTGLHAEWIPKALDAGKHVLAEKSFASTHSEAVATVAKAREKGLLVMENFMFRFHRQHAFVRELIGNGEIGEIRLFRSSFGFPPFPPDNFRYDAELGGGALLDAAAYTVKASQLFLGADLEVRAANLHRNEKGIDIYGGAYLSTPEGLVSEVGFGFDNFYQCNYEIWGSKGKITAERAFTPPPDFKPKIVLEKQGDRKEFLVEPENHFARLLEEFVRAVRENEVSRKQKDFSRHYDETVNQSRLLDQIRKKDEGNGGRG